MEYTVSFKTASLRTTNKILLRVHSRLAEMNLFKSFQKWYLHQQRPAATCLHIASCYFSKEEKSVLKADQSIRRSSEKSSNAISRQLPTAVSFVSQSPLRNQRLRCTASHLTFGWCCSAPLKMKVFPTPGRWHLPPPPSSLPTTPRCLPRSWTAQWATWSSPAPAAGADKPCQPLSLLVRPQCLKVSLSLCWVFVSYQKVGGSNPPRDECHLYN